MRGAGRPIDPTTQLLDALTSDATLNLLLRTTETEFYRIQGEYRYYNIDMYDEDDHFEFGFYLDGRKSIKIWIRDRDTRTNRAIDVSGDKLRDAFSDFLTNLRRRLGSDMFPVVVIAVFDSKEASQELYSNEYAFRYTLDGVSRHNEGLELAAFYPVFHSRQHTAPVSSPSHFPAKFQEWVKTVNDALRDYLPKMSSSESEKMI